MNIVVVVILLFGLPDAVGAMDALNSLSLPKGAVVIETESLRPKGYPNRAIVLWMVTPTKHPSYVERDPDYAYSCPETTRGSYYSGLVRVSLVDTTSDGIINTVELEEPFDVPYRIRKGRYYHVRGRPSKNREGRAQVLFLRDYNGDGRALEFALFEAIACMGLSTALFGYAPERDRLIQYPIRREVTEDTKRTVSVSGWCDYLFGKKPRSPGLWKYCIDYRGRGGSLDKYEIRYDPKREMFDGTLVRTEAEDAECSN